MASWQTHLFRNRDPLQTPKNKEFRGKNPSENHHNVTDGCNGVFSVYVSLQLTDHVANLRQHQKNQFRHITPCQQHSSPPASREQCFQSYNLQLPWREISQGFSEHISELNQATSESSKLIKMILTVTFCTRDIRVRYRDAQWPLYHISGARTSVIWPMRKVKPRWRPFNVNGFESRKCHFPSIIPVFLTDRIANQVISS